ncbi:MAG: peptidoglycan bridge formation glycyltransferase FemA/FemB family protein [Candidatus Pacebacteria bacterium]|nr:peptidoglycan bridge formation glycyltransferase FemA/FemB family protein [Candidatus Paceibacterota bacterium]
MEVREIKNKEEWENFLLLCQEKTFCHSWNWGDFNSLLGSKVWRFGVFNAGLLLAVFQVIGIKAKRGSFLFVPHGPIFLKEHEKKKEILGNALDFLKQLGKKEEAWFLRIAPLLLRTEENNQLFEYFGFINAPMHMHPEITWELDLTLPEDQLLKNMRKTTRYLIRQAEKEGVDVVKSTRKEELERFEEIYWETAKRHSFVPFSKEYLEKEFEVFSKDNQAMMFSGKHNGDVLSSAMIIFHSQRAFYHQGASLPSKIPASYLVQWEAIKEAKTRGCQRYNFWGIVPGAEQSHNHPWKGLTLFKKGFGGEEKDYVKTKDYPLSWKYWLVFAFEQLRRRKRNL